MIRHVDMKKQKKLDQYLSNYNFSFDNLISLIKLGIKRSDKGTKTPGAFRDGLYLGCPGKDIHFALMSYLTDEQEDMIVDCFARSFPVVPPVNHVHMAAAIRYIYGCFDKRGCLLSKEYQDIVAQLDWSKPNKFIDKLKIKFEQLDNPLGLLILYEMKAHRIGDLAIVTNNATLMEEMINSYQLSISYLPEMQRRYKDYLYKHTSHYWCACYLERFDENNAVEYHIKNLRFLEKHCVKGKKDDKIIHSIQYIKKRIPKPKWILLRSEILKYRQRCFEFVKNKI